MQTGRTTSAYQITTYLAKSSTEDSFFSQKKDPSEKDGFPNRVRFSADYQSNFSSSSLFNFTTLLKFLTALSIMGRFRFSTTLVFLTVALLAFPCTDSSAQDVAVEAYTETNTGQSLVFEIKEKFRSSEAFELSQTNTTIYLNIFAMPYDEENPNSPVIFSVVWTIPSDMENPNVLHYHYDHTMGYAGTLAYQETATAPALGGP
jgi:hypothetical protein